MVGWNSGPSQVSDGVGDRHPHLMFFVPQTDTATWGANLPSSPILEIKADPDRLFLISVASGRTVRLI
jgi:hypothetical protein